MMDRIYYKGTLYLYRTWVSYPGTMPDDFPEKFDLDDFDGEPDLEGMERAAKQKELLWETPEKQ